MQDRGFRVSNPPMGFKARKRSNQRPAEAARSGGQKSEILPLHEVIRRAIIDAVEAHDSLRQAANALEMPVSSLRDKLDQFGIDIPGRRSRSHRAQPAFTVESSEP